MKNFHFSLSVFLFSIFLFFSCSESSMKNPQLDSFEQKKLESYVDDLGINWKYEIYEKRKLKDGMWSIEIIQNQDGGDCEKNYIGDILIQNDTIFLLANYIYNEPKYKDIIVEAPVNNCGSSFRYIIKGITDINNYIII